MAKDITVGDKDGWKLDFDYRAWAKGKEFSTSIQLHNNVYKVDGKGFRECTNPAGQNALDSGKDVITLSTPGKKWCICGVANHCESGLKLVINVQQKEGSSVEKSGQGQQEILDMDDFFICTLRHDNVLKSQRLQWKD